MSEEEWYVDAKKFLSAERLDAYEARVPGDACEVVGTYLWNTALCEALYPSLQTVEIALRNSIDRAARHQFGDAWLERGDLLDSFASHRFSEARSKLARRGIDPTSRSLVAELDFGFWTSLMNRHYDRILWPALIFEAFPHIPKTLRQRHPLSTRFQAIRRLRNRVFHHEPIWHWSDLPRQHDEVIEAITWMCGSWHETLLTIDRFQSTLSAGAETYIEKLRSWGQAPANTEVDELADLLQMAPQE